MRLLICRVINMIMIGGSQFYESCLTDNVQNELRVSYRCRLNI
jgi:hypothetical protein